MLRWITFALIVVVLVAGASFFSMTATLIEPTAHPVVAAPVGPQPKLEVVGPLTYEFGIMPQLTAGTHTWEFKNTGEADLALWLDGTTCSCTVAKLKSAEGEEKPKLVVKPKASTRILVEWNTKTFREKYNQGVTIATNDRAQPSVGLNVSGTVQPPVFVIPGDLVAFNSVSNEQPNHAKVAVFSLDRPETKITKAITSRSEFLVVTPRPLTAQECEQLKCKAGYEADVEMKVGMPLGRFHEELLIETDHPLRPEIKMAITGIVGGPITVIPQRLRMSNVSTSRGASQEMTLLVRGNRPVHFEVAYHPKKIDVKITPDTTPTQKGKYKMTVTVPKGTAAGPVDDEIILKTDHPQAGEMKIPVSIFISNSTNS